MNNKITTSLLTILILGIFLIPNRCSKTTKDNAKDSTKPNAQNDTKKEVAKDIYASDVISIFDKFNLVLGDGFNVGQPINFENEEYFYTENEGGKNWVVYKTPNAGDVHGTSNNTRTELGQIMKWSPMMNSQKSASHILN